MQIILTFCSFFPIFSPFQLSNILPFWQSKLTYTDKNLHKTLLHHFGTGFDNYQLEAKIDNKIIYYERKTISRQSTG